jgi:predicted RNase H-like HicB family nuclease/predicted DNA binding CopG/RHH family protein
MKPDLPAAYVAVLHVPETARGAWGVTFPDLPGCVSSGATDLEASQNAREALAGHVAALVADGDPVPKARTLRDLLQDEDYLADIRSTGVAMWVELDELPAPKERVNVMLARDVLRQIDKAAAAKGLSRSAYIEAAAGRAAQKRFI